MNIANLVATFLVASASYTQQPQRAIDPKPNYQIINATDKQLTLYQGYSDEEVTFNPKSSNSYPYSVSTEANFYLFITKADYPTAPTDFYYIYNAPDFEDPINITFEESPLNRWTATISGYGPSQGLQIGRYEYLTGQTYYFDPQKLNQLTIGATGADGSTTDENLIDGLTLKVRLDNGTFTQTTSAITAITQNIWPRNIVYLCFGTTIENDNLMACNYNVRLQASGEKDVNQILQPYFIWDRGYWNQKGYTNEVVFQSGHKTIKYGTLNGQDPYYFSKSNKGYTAMNDENTSTLATIQVGADLVGMSFGVVGQFFEWYIFPGITLGVLLLVPIMFGMIVWIIKFLKKG